VSEVSPNDYIWYKPNDRSMEILEHRREELNQLIISRRGKPLDGPLETADSEGWVKVQLWSFMETFGPACVMGGEHPFYSLRLTPPTG